jgi:LDH2 family malate/lactate/ureidoglycolate dehydrogenase
MDWIDERCESNPPVHPDRPVRLPGRRGLALREQAAQQGVPLSSGIVAGLAPWSEKLQVAMPPAVSTGE